jgi:hypothetical protein
LLVQVRNLASCVKVAVDFVLPESLDQAFKFAEEFCTMGKVEAWENTSEGERVYIQPADRQHTDKLQAELSMCLAAKHAVQVLAGTATGQIISPSCCLCCCPYSFCCFHMPLHKMHVQIIGIEWRFGCTPGTNEKIQVNAE